METDKVLNNYHKWLSTIITEYQLSILDRLIIYNSVKSFSYSDQIIGEDFLAETEEIVDNLVFDELNQIPKFHILLYTMLNNNNSSTSLFIKEWLLYLKSDISEERYDFPYCFLSYKVKNIDLISSFKNYDLLKSNIETYTSLINIGTDFGKNKEFTFSEKYNTHLLEALMLQFYKKEYNLLLGNLVFRSLIYLGQNSNNTAVSCANYIALQQNINGYFGNYLKDQFSKDEITAILNISFDCILTILEFQDESLRINNKIKNTFF